MNKEFEEFKRRWEKKAEVIKKQKFSKEQCGAMHSEFVEESGTLMVLSKKGEVVIEVNKVLTDVNLAIRIASSNYRDSRKSWLDKIKLRIENINLFKQR